MKGMFFTFEGPDGGGKSTQLRLLEEALLKNDRQVITTREPGGTHISDQVRHILLDPNNTAMAAKTELLLYAASRAQHVQEKIRPALQAGSIVLCDRFIDASMAYQGVGLDIGEAWVRQLNEFATSGLQPDRTYLLDIAPEQAFRRMHDRQQNEFGQTLDRIEQREWTYHRKVRSAFHELASNEERILMLDGSQAEQDLHRVIMEDAWQIVRIRQKS